MPKGPQGQKRPADVVRNIVQVMRIATGEEEEKRGPSKAEVRSAAGKKGGAARAQKVSATKRAEIAKAAARKRWAKVKQATD